MHIYNICLLLCVFGVSCNHDTTQSKHNSGDILKKEALVKANKYLVEQDDEMIKNYITRKGWEMKRTTTGLWYMIYKKGTNDVAESNDNIIYDYRSELLDGSQCYNTDSTGPSSIQIGYANVESGLHQVFLHLHKGDEAKVILPPHLAFGLLGDNNKIPRRSVVVYDIKVRDIIKSRTE